MDIQMPLMNAHASKPIDIDRVVRLLTELTMETNGRSGRANNG